MADTKVSEKTSATGTNSADYLYLIQNGISKKITVADFFGAVPVEASFAQKVKLSGNTLTNTGAIPVDKSVVQLRFISTPHAVTLPAGETNQLLVLHVSNYSTTDAFVDVSGTFVGANGLRFTAIGQSATLLSNGTGWIILNNTGTTT